MANATEERRIDDVDIHSAGILCDSEAVIVNARNLTMYSTEGGSESLGKIKMTIVVASVSKENP